VNVNPFFIISPKKVIFSPDSGKVLPSLDWQNKNKRENIQVKFEAIGSENRNGLRGTGTNCQYLSISVLLSYLSIDNLISHQWTFTAVANIKLIKSWWTKLLFSGLTFFLIS
jgi:hypothetical protein